MKLAIQFPKFCVPSFCTIIFLLSITYSSSYATSVIGCDDYICEDMTLFEPLPHILELDDLTGEYCENLSFSPDILNPSLTILNEGITSYTIYNLLTGDSCTANIEMICQVACPDEYSAFLELDIDSFILQPIDISPVSCYFDEVFLPPYDSGVFTEGEHEVVIYSAALDDSCTTQLSVTTECFVIECNFRTKEYYNTTLWPQRVLEVPCPDTTAYLMEVLDENDEVILSGNSIYLNESLPEVSDIRITHIETGNSCTSELNLFHNCLQNLKDTLFLDFTDVQSIVVPWDSFFTVPCEHQVEPGYGIGHGFQGDAIDILEDGAVYFKNTVQDAHVLFSDSRTDSLNSVPVHFRNLSLSNVQGYVFQDLEGDCAVETIPELGAENILIYAIGEADTFFTRSGIDGLFDFQLPEFYNYDIGMLETNNFWDICVNESPLYLGEDTASVHIGLSVDTLCSYLTAYLSLNRLRRCFDNYIYMDYCNLGSDTAYDVTLDFYFDEGLDINPEDYGFTVVDANHFQLDIGTLAPLECEELRVTAFVDCDLDLDTELCVEIELGPIPDCNDTEEWSGAALDVQGFCDGDSVRFIITNIGDADMTGPREFIVIEDDIMIIHGDVNLPEGESSEKVLPANGSTYRLMADQEPFHPYTEKISALVKACSEGGSGISTGFANSFILDEQAPFISIECFPVVGSYDPNDKAVTPTGAYENHIISGDEKLEYMIRFENVGNDTAFNVLVRDTLDSNLNLLTFRLVGSSHPVEVDFPTDGVVNFRFLNIALPDTSVNKLEAQGFVKFTIYPKQDLAIETKIYNSADIYFDFNPAILTNEVDLQVGEFNATNLVNIPQLRNGFITPNPAKLHLNIQSDFDYFIIQDARGITHIEGTQTSRINIKALSSGIYFISIFENEKRIGIDRFVKIE